MRESACGFSADVSGFMHFHLPAATRGLRGESRRVYSGGFGGRLAPQQAAWGGRATRAPSEVGRQWRRGAIDGPRRNVCLACGSHLDFKTPGRPAAGSRQQSDQEEEEEEEENLSNAVDQTPAHARREACRGSSMHAGMRRAVVPPRAIRALSIAAAQRVSLSFSLRYDGCGGPESLP